MGARSRLTFGPFVARLQAQLGKGNFGTVLAGRHKLTDTPVAIKLEPEDTRRPRIPVEAAVYRELDEEAGFAKMLYYGRGHGYLALVMERLGPSLRTIHRTRHEDGRSFDAALLAHIADEVVLRLQTLHSFGWLHCDVKPANVLLDADPAGIEREGLEGAPWPRLSLVDFGLCRRWGDERERFEERRRQRRPGTCVGTGRFASLSNHEGIEPLGRRDDLESLALSLVFLAAGRLPWSGVAPPPDFTKAERFQAMLERKRATPIDELSEAMPPGFADFLIAIRSLAHDEPPDYERLRRMVREWPGSTR